MANLAAGAGPAAALAGPPAAPFPVTRSVRTRQRFAAGLRAYAVEFRADHEGHRDTQLAIAEERAAAFILVDEVRHITVWRRVLGLSIY